MRSVIRVVGHSDSGEVFPEPGGGLQHPVPAVEGADPDEPLAAGAEPAARHGDDMRLVEDLREHVPGAAPREAHPHVGRVGAAVHLLAERRERVHQHARVLLVHGYHAAHGVPAFLRGEAGEPPRLRDAGGAVEAGAHDAVEVARHGRAVRVPELAGHHRPAEPDAREPRELGEGADLDGHLPGAGHLVDGLRLAVVAAAAAFKLTLRRFCAPSEMNTSDSFIPMFGYTFSAMTLRRFCTFS